jgi:CRP-like cAMP-binding protein
MVNEGVMFLRTKRNRRLLELTIGDWVLLVIGLTLAGSIALLAWEEIAVGGFQNMVEQADRIVAILRKYPNGLTAQEVADQLGSSKGNISSRLSKLVAYGVIKRRKEKIVVGVPATSIYTADQSQSVQ